MSLKIACISDTHTKHEDLDIPECDIIICAGDITGRGSVWDVQSFLKWFNKLPIKHKVFIAGNHDFAFEANRTTRSSTSLSTGNDLKILETMLSGMDIHYLFNSGVEIEGIKIWGSPYQPWFHDWAFNFARDVRQGEKQAIACWDLIPEDTEILITHGPPRGVLDFTFYDKLHVGCEYLLRRINVIKPKLHIFGHIHEGAGEMTIGDTHFVNASSCTLQYKPTNPVIVVDWK